MTKTRIVAVLTILLLLLGSCKSTPKIEGTVKDYWGKPLASVTVKISNSTFEALTDSEGHYSVEYVPGNISVEYSKPNFQQETLSLNITAAAVFPAADVKMFPVPVPSGVAVLDSSGLQTISPVSITHRTFSKRGNDPMGLITETHDVATVGESSTLVGSGWNFNLIENVSSNLRLIRLAPDGTIIDIWRSAMTVGNEGRFDLIKDQVRTMRQARLHTVGLSPGRYAYVDIAPQSMFQGMHIASQRVYPFTVQ